VWFYKSCIPKKKTQLLNPTNLTARPLADQKYCRTLTTMRLSFTAIFCLAIGASATEQLEFGNLRGGSGTITASTAVGAKQLMIPPIAIAKGLRVISYKRPAGCETNKRSKIGDLLTVDYTGWLCVGASCTKGKQVCLFVYLFSLLLSCVTPPNSSTRQ
jgi:hypothetical protein